MVKLRDTSVVSLAAFLSMALFGCSKEASYHEIGATYCVLADANSRSDTDKLFQSFRRFANLHNLTVDSSDPANRSLISQDGSELIRITGFLGQYGATISYHSRSNSDSTLKNDLVSFVDGKLNTDFSIQDCDDVVGFEDPVMFRNE